MYTEAAWNEKNLPIPGKIIQLLSEDIRRNARGIFLWARLAIDELLQCYMNGHSVEMLQQLLEKMPREVEEMYHSMLDRLVPVQRTEAAILLSMVVCHKDSVEVRKLYVALHAVVERAALQGLLLPIDIEDKNEARIMAILGGFLDLTVLVPEVHVDEGSDDACGYYRTPQLMWVNRALNLRRNVSTEVKMTHRILLSFLSTSSWLTDNLPSSFKSRYPNDFWARIYAEEILKQPEADISTRNRIILKLKQFLKHICVEFSEDAFISRKYNQEKSLITFLEIWPHWTSLLPYALQSLLTEVKQAVFMDQTLETQVSSAIQTNCFLLHPALCLYLERDFWHEQDLELVTCLPDIAEVDNCGHLVLKPSLWKELILKSNCTHAGTAMAVCHGLTQVIEYRLNHNYSITSEEQQILFNNVFEKYLDSNFSTSYETILQKLASNGARMGEEHLSYFFDDKSNAYAKLEFFFGLMENSFFPEEDEEEMHTPHNRSSDNPQDAGSETDKSEIEMDEAQSATPEARFLGYWALWDVPQDDSGKEKLQKLLNLLILRGEPINGLCSDGSSQAHLLHILLSPSQITLRTAKFILAMQAGLGPFKRRAESPLLNSRHKRLREIKRRAEEYMVYAQSGQAADNATVTELCAQAEQFNKLLEIVQLTGRLPPNLEDYDSFDYAKYSLGSRLHDDDDDEMKGVDDIEGS